MAAKIIPHLPPKTAERFCALPFLLREGENPRGFVRGRAASEAIEPPACHLHFILMAAKIIPHLPPKTAERFCAPPFLLCEGREPPRVRARTRSVRSHRAAAYSRDDHGKPENAPFDDLSPVFIFVYSLPASPLPPARTAPHYLWQ